MPPDVAKVNSELFLVLHKTQTPSDSYRNAAGAMRADNTATSQGQTEEKQSKDKTKGTQNIQ